MAHRQGGHRTKTLLFPSNWTKDWLVNAITSTSKWQAKSILNSYKFGQWISFEASALNGLNLPARSDPATNYIRSVVVGARVHQASESYERMMNKVPLDEKVKNLENLMRTPIVGDMIQNMTEANLPTPSYPEPSVNRISIPSAPMMPAREEYNEIGVPGEEEMEETEE